MKKGETQAGVRASRTRTSPSTMPTIGRRDTISITVTVDVLGVEMLLDRRSAVEEAAGVAYDLVAEALDKVVVRG